MKSSNAESVCGGGCGLDSGVEEMDKEEMLYLLELLRTFIRTATQEAARRQSETCVAVALWTRKCVSVSRSSTCGQRERILV